MVGSGLVGSGMVVRPPGSALISGRAYCRRMPGRLGPPSPGRDQAGGCCSMRRRRPSSSMVKPRSNSRVVSPLRSASPSSTSRGWLVGRQLGQVRRVDGPTVGHLAHAAHVDQHEARARTTTATGTRRAPRRGRARRRAGCRRRPRAARGPRRCGWPGRRTSGARPGWARPASRKPRPSTQSWSSQASVGSGSGTSRSTWSSTPSSTSSLFVDVVVERHGLDAERGAELAHAERLEPVLVDDRHRGGDDPLAAERDPVRHRHAASLEPRASGLDRTHCDAGQVPRADGSAGRGSVGDEPLEDVEGAEAGGVDEGLGLADAGAGPDGLEVAEVGPLVPDAAALGDQLVDAVGARGTSAWIGAASGGRTSGELVERRPRR